MIHCVCHGNKFGKLNLVFGVQIPAAWHQQKRQMMSFPLFHWYHLFVKVVVHIRTSHLRPITALPSSERVEFIQTISLIRCLLHFALLCDLQQSVQFIIINKGQWLKLTSDWFLQNMKFCHYSDFSVKVTRLLIWWDDCCRIYFICKSWAINHKKYNYIGTDIWRVHNHLKWIPISKSGPTADPLFWLLVHNIIDLLNLPSWKGKCIRQQFPCKVIQIWIRFNRCVSRDYDMTRNSLVRKRN